MSRRRKGARVLFTGWVITASSALASPSPAANAIVYPATRTVDQLDTYHGEEIADPYRWLEDEASPEVSAWAAAQNSLTEAFAGEEATSAIAQRIQGYRPSSTRIDSRSSAAAPSSLAAGPDHLTPVSTFAKPRAPSDTSPARSFLAAPRRRREARRKPPRCETSGPLRTANGC